MSKILINLQLLKHLDRVKKGKIFNSVENDSLSVWNESECGRKGGHSGLRIQRKNFVGSKIPVRQVRRRKQVSGTITFKMLRDL